jgi:IclR family acetate operon transcriptional repressor
VARTGQASRGRVGSAERAFAALDVLAEEGALGTNELARRTGMSPSTASRQLGTLLECGLVEFDEVTRRYRLGLRLVQLGNAVLSRLDVRDLARPHLEALVAAVQETATLSVPGDPDAITIDFVPTAHYVQGVTRLGRPSIAHATAAGKVMLAFGRGVPVGRLAAYTERTIVDPAVLARELQRVRLAGWAEACGEREPDLNAVAGPVWDAGGGLAAIVALQGPAGRFRRGLARKAVPLLLERTAAVSAALGWRGTQLAQRRAHA